jgi:PhnB protein
VIITPNLEFNGDCRQALALYSKAFSSDVTTLVEYGDANPSDLPRELTEAERAYVYHAEMLFGGRRVFLADSLDGVQCGTNVSLTVTFRSADEVRAAHALLIAGGRTLLPLRETAFSGCTATLVDRFGVRWGLMLEDR